ncbi:MAG TPA: KEOPS complex kinase/ATPase Bud32 [Candidatus Nanoarchaeia archaeon]|nr:KEOPS complex kinase/ATPase Bud32 [Candidatus Nanoarchaeia archaeon]
MQKQVIAQGAEAKIYLEEGKLIKERVSKSYRHPHIDKKLRLQRTRQEARIMKKVPFAPTIYQVDETTMKIIMDYYPEPPLKKPFATANTAERKKICKNIGKNLAYLHQNDIIHGDLTTNNMILHEGEVKFIDFGLSVISNKIEDKAVDLHLLRQALNSRHHKIAEESFQWVLEAYQTYAEAKTVLERLNNVERRGRYKRKQKAQP